MWVSVADDLRCPKCRNVDTVQLASSNPERFSPPRRPVFTRLDAPLVAVMLAFLVASLPFLAGSLSRRLTDWPVVLPALHGLLPKPLIAAVIVVSIILVAIDGGTRQLLLRLGRAAALDSRLYREIDGYPSPGAGVALSVGLAGFGWGVFLALRSVDSWLQMSRSTVFIGTGWVSLAVQGFLEGAVVVLAGWPALCLVMAYIARVFADTGALETTPASFAVFARNLGYPYSLLPVLMGLSLSSGIQALVALSLGWFLVSMVIAARPRLNDDTLLALAVTLLGAVPPSLLLLLATNSVQLGVVDSLSGKARASAAAIDLESLWFVGALTLAMALALVSLLAAIWRRWENARIDRAWGNAVARWRRLLYCRHCDGLYLPGEGRLVEAGEVSRQLERDR